MHLQVPRAVPRAWQARPRGAPRAGRSLRQFTKGVAVFAHPLVGGTHLGFEIRIVGRDSHRSVRRLGEEQGVAVLRSEEHTSELQSLMRISYAVFCLKKKK